MLWEFDQADAARRFDTVAESGAALAAIEAGLAVLVGHSYGGAVITEAGNHPNVAALVENLRLEGARALMEDTNHTIDVVAQESGFRDRNRMRRAFLRSYGQPPQVIRHLSQALAPLGESKSAGAEGAALGEPRVNVARSSQRQKNLRPTKHKREGRARRRGSKYHR